MKLSEETAIDLVETLLEKECVETLFEYDKQKTGFVSALLWNVLNVKERDGIYTIDEASDSFLLYKAQKSQGAYDLMSLICRSHVGEGHPLSKAQRLFTASVLAGELSRPTQEVVRCTSAQNFLRNELFVRYMKILTGPKCGLNPTRNDASVGGSAADVIVSALERHNVTVTYDTVVNAWKNKRLKRELEALMP